MATKGIRLNNPGNIEKGLNWLGLADVQPDPRFCAFISPEYGIRAIVKILQTYSKKHGLWTIAEIINRWAPPSENKTDKYASNVSIWTGFPVNKVLDLNDRSTLLKLTKAITRQENGIVPWDDSVYLAGINLILKE